MPYKSLRLFRSVLKHQLKKNAHMGNILIAERFAAGTNQPVVSFQIEKFLVDVQSPPTPLETRRVALPLIKAFQKEVDQLTVRGKATEAALIEICSQLTNLPGEEILFIAKEDRALPSRGAFKDSSPLL
ncbi:hypothetical protein COOONC_01204 [Cooperia oncophora]